MKLVGGIAVAVGSLAIGWLSADERSTGIPAGPTGLASTSTWEIPRCPSGRSRAFGPTVSAATPPPPLSGGTLLMLPTARRRSRPIPIATRPTSSTSSAGTLTATVALNAGDEPGRAVEDAAGKVHVVLRRAGARRHHRSGDGDRDRAQGGLRGAARHRLRRGHRSRPRRLRRRRARLAAGGGRRRGAHASRSSAICATSPSSARSCGSRRSARRRSSSSTTPTARCTRRVVLPDATTSAAASSRRRWRGA